MNDSGKTAHRLFECDETGEGEEGGKGCTWEGMVGRYRQV